MFLSQMNTLVGSRRKSALLGTLCGLATLYATGPAQAVNWVIQPSVDLSATYTDNATLTEPKNDDFLITGRASVDITGRSQRVEAAVNGSVEYDKYLDESRFDGARVEFLGVSRFNLIENKFTVDARASVSEENVFRSSPSPARPRTTSENGTRIVIYSITPQFRQQFGSSLEGIVGVTASGSNYGDRDVGTTFGEPEDTNSVQLDASIGTVVEKPGYQWRLSGYIFEDDEDFKRNTVQAFLQIPMSSKIAPYVIVGHDDIDNPRINEDARSGEFYLVGVTFTPGARLIADVAIGDRYGDTSGSANITYNFSDSLALFVSYSEDVLTEQQSLEEALSAVGISPEGVLLDDLRGDPGLLDSLLDIRDVVFKENRFRVGLNGKIGRNEIRSAAHLVKRKYDASNTDEEILGVSLGVTRRVSRKLSAYGDVEYSDVLSSRFGLDDDKRVQGRLGLRYDLSTSLSVAGEYAYINNMREIVKDITENAFTVSLRKTF